jgi:predicted transcriptional regulator
LRRSKLETYEAILAALVKRPLKLDSLAYKVKMDCVALQRHLGFLTENGLVEERFLAKGTLYTVTERGTSVFKALDLQKYLKRLQNTLMVMDEAIQVKPEISKRRDKSEKELPSEKY